MNYNYEEIIVFLWSFNQLQLGERDDWRIVRDKNDKELDQIHAEILNVKLGACRFRNRCVN